MDKTESAKTGYAKLSEAEVAKRVEALLARMSLAEKIGQLNQVGGADFAPGPKAENQIRAGGAGSVLWVNDTRRFNELQKIAVEESPSAIPLLFALDVIHGYRTIFPVPLAMASSWDPAVPEQSQAVVARETRAAGIHWTFAPMIDIARDARWGASWKGPGKTLTWGGDGDRPGARLPGRRSGRPGAGAGLRQAFRWVWRRRRRSRL